MTCSSIVEENRVYYMLSVTFEGFATDVTTVGTTLFVLAGLVADEGAFFCESLLTDITAEGTLASVRPVVFI